MLHIQKLKAGQEGLGDDSHVAACVTRQIYTPPKLSFQFLFTVFLASLPWAASLKVKQLLPFQFQNQPQILYFILFFGSLTGNRIRYFKYTHSGFKNSHPVKEPIYSISSNLNQMEKLKADPTVVSIWDKSEMAIPEGFPGSAVG